MTGEQKRAVQALYDEYREHIGDYKMIHKPYERYPDTLLGFVEWLGTVFTEEVLAEVIELAGEQPLLVDAVQ